MQELQSNFQRLSIDDQQNHLFQLSTNCIENIGKNLSIKDIANFSQSCLYAYKNLTASLLQENDDAIVKILKVLLGTKKFVPRHLHEAINTIAFQSNFSERLTHFNLSMLSTYEIRRSVPENLVKCFRSFAKLVIKTQYLFDLISDGKKLEIAVMAKRKRIVKNGMKKEKEIHHCPFAYKYLIKELCSLGDQFRAFSIIGSLYQLRKKQLSFPVGHMIQAAKYGNIKMMKYLRDDFSCIINKAESKARTALHQACLHSKNQAILYLLQQGAKVEAVDENGNNALHMVCRRRNFEGAKLVLSHIQEISVINAVNNYKKTPLTYAVESGCVESVKLLFTLGANVTSETLQEHLDTAIFRGYVHVVEFFLKFVISSGLEIDPTRHFLVAHHHGHAQVARVFYAHGFRYKHTPKLFNKSCKKGHTEYIRFLLEISPNDSKLLKYKSKNKNTSLHYACIQNHTKTAILLLDNGFDPLARNSEDMTCLHYACQRGNIAIVKKLIEKKVDPNALGNGFSPLSQACFSGDIEIVQFLLNNGAYVDGNNDQKNPLCLAVLLTRIGIVNLLLQHEANPNWTSPDGLTPLHIVADLGFCESTRIVELTNLLVNHGGRIGALDKRGRSPLDVAITSNYEISVKVKVLVDNGANINAKDKDGNTLLHYAIFKGNLEQVKILIENGIDVCAKNNLKQTPLHLAIIHGDSEIIQYLLDNGALATLYKKDVEKNTPLKLVRHYEVLCQILDKAALQNFSGHEPLIKYIMALNFSNFKMFIFSIVPAKTVSLLFKASSPKQKTKILNALIDTSHYTSRSFLCDMPVEVPENIRLNSLKEFFHDINFENSTSPNFVDSRNLEDDSKPIEVATLQLQLYTLIKNIKKRIAFLATPKEGDYEGLEAYYKPIEDSLKLVIDKVLKVEDPIKRQKLQTKVALDLARAGGHCGDRYISTAEDLYFEIVLERPNTFEEKIYRTLDKARRNFLIQAANSVNTHKITTFFRLLGKDYSIPGAFLCTFKDPFAVPITKKEANKKYVEYFNFENIFSCICQELLERETKDQFIDWAKDHLKIEEIESLQDYYKKAQKYFKTLLYENLGAKSIFEMMNAWDKESEIEIYYDPMTVEEKFKSKESIYNAVTRSIQSARDGKIGSVLFDEELVGGIHQVVKKEIIFKMLVQLNVINPKILELMDFV